MKKILLAVAFIASGLMANADNYSTISLSYDNTQLMANKKGVLSMMGYADKDKSGSLNGFGVQYNYGIGISKLPMNIEVGLKFSMGFLNKSENFGDYGLNITADYATTMMRLGIPVSYIYHIDVKDGFRIAPYAGLDFRFNLLANTKYSFSGYIPNEDSSYDREELDPATSSYFSKEDMAGQTANRFQMGWHLGVRFEFKKLFLGVEYGTDFIPFYSQSYLDLETNKSTKYTLNTGNLAVSVGYTF